MKNSIAKLAIGTVVLAVLFGAGKANAQYSLPIHPETVVDMSKDWRRDIPGRQNKVSFRFNIGTLPYFMSGVNGINLKMNLEENGFYGPMEAPEGSVYYHLKGNSCIEDCYGIVSDEDGWLAITGYMDDKAINRDENGEIILNIQKVILSDYENWTLTDAFLPIPQYNGRKMKNIKIRSGPKNKTD